MNDTCDEKKLETLFDDLTTKYLHFTEGSNTKDFMDKKKNNKADIASECAVHVFCDKINSNNYYGLTKEGTFNIYPEKICSDKQVEKKFLEENIDSTAVGTIKPVATSTNTTTIKPVATPSDTTTNKVSGNNNVVQKKKFSVIYSPIDLMKLMKPNDTKIPQNELNKYEFKHITSDDIEKTIKNLTNEINELENANNDLEKEISTIEPTDDKSLIGLKRARRESNIAIIANKRKSRNILNQIKPLVSPSKKKGGKIRKTKCSKKTKRSKTKKLH